MRIVHELPQTTCLVLCKRKLAEVAVYSPACSHCCGNKHLTPDYCGNVLESKGIRAGSSPIGCEGFVKASKVQGSSPVLSNASNFVGYSYIYIANKVVPQFVNAKLVQITPTTETVGSMVDIYRLVTMVYKQTSLTNWGTT